MSRNEFSTDPEENVGRQNIPAIPYDENNMIPFVMYGLVIENDEPVGYLPIKVTDNGDGTCTRA